MMTKAEAMSIRLISENMRLQVKLVDAEFSAYMHEQYARTALELARKNKKEANIID